jgi:hypothetical protein
MVALPERFSFGLYHGNSRKAVHDPYFLDPCWRKLCDRRRFTQYCRCLTGDAVQLTTPPPRYSWWSFYLASMHLKSGSPSWWQRLITFSVLIAFFLISSDWVVFCCRRVQKPCVGLCWAASSNWSYLSNNQLYARDEGRCHWNPPLVINIPDILWWENVSFNSKIRT